MTLDMSEKKPGMPPQAIPVSFRGLAHRQLKLCKY